MLSNLARIARTGGVWGSNTKKTSTTILDASTGTILAGSTFTRSGSVGGRYNSSGVWVDEAANTPRLDHDITGPHNLLLYSEDFTNAVWSKTGGTTATASTTSPPVMGMAVWQIVLPSGGGGSQLWQTVGSISSSATVGIWVRASSPVDISFGFYDSTSDIQTVSVTSTWQFVSRTRSSGMTSGDRRACWIYGGAGSNITFEVAAPRLSAASSAATYVATTSAVKYSPRGWLLEEARTNLITVPNDLAAGSPWTTNGMTSVTANAANDIRGVANIDRLQENTATTGHTAVQAVSLTTGTTYTHSFFTKAANGGRYIASNWTSAFTANPRVVFDLQNVTATVNAGNPANTGRITAHAQSLYRAQHTFTTTSTASSNMRHEMSPDGTTFTSYTGDGNRQIFVGDVQVEAGAFATTLIPGGGTRNAETWTWPTSAIPGFSASEGRLVMVARSPGVGVRVLAQFDDGSDSNRIVIYTNGVALVAQVDIGGSSVATLSLGSITPYAECRVAISWAANNFAASLNGAANVTDTSGAVPGLTTLFVGTGRGHGHLGGHIKKLVYYPTADASSLPTLSA